MTVWAAALVEEHSAHDCSGAGLVSGSAGRSVPGWLAGQDLDATVVPTAAAEPGGEHSGKGVKAPDAGSGAAHDPHAPEIRALGPVEVTGVDSSGHGPRVAQLATLLYFRPGRQADVLCDAMDPISPWSASTLNARLQGLRRCLGNDPHGRPYVPRRSAGEDPYRLSPGAHCDWTRFHHLAERALLPGPAGLPDPEKALTPVRGTPFGGKPLPWAEPLAQEITTRITDTAHTVATYRTTAELSARSPLPPPPPMGVGGGVSARSEGAEGLLSIRSSAHGWCRCRGGCRRRWSARFPARGCRAGRQGWSGSRRGRRRGVLPTVAG